MPTTHSRFCALTGASLTALLAAASLCGAAPKADPAATARARQSIQAIYNRQAKGLADKDINALFAGDAPDAVSIDVDGHSSPLAAGRQTMTQMISVMQHADGMYRVQSVTLDGDHATVMVKQHSHMVLAPPKRPTVDLVVDNTSRDLWVKTPGGWKMKRSTDLTEVVKQNGKVVSKH
jgi:ketosteroid isomerase-like protein